MFGLNRLRLNSQGGSLGFAVQRALFNVGEQGLWYDLNDDSTMFQDSAGTTLASWGDPVGLVLDKHEGDGRGVVNRLLRTQEFDDAYWFKSLITVAANNIAAPDGTLTADRILETASTGFHVLARQNFVFVAGVYTYSVYVQALGRDLVAINGSGTESRFNLSTVSVVSSTLGSATITDVGGGWRRLTVTGTATAGAANLNALVLLNDVGASSYAGDITKGAYIWGAQLELGSTATAYQANGASVGGPGNHAIQSTSGARPIRGRVPKRGRVNELVSTATMATQNVTVTNAQRTLSFTGTGTVTLSGTSTAGPLVGTGANDRVSLTFTPTAGTLTLTVTGSVTLAQLQLGAAFDSYQAVNDSLGFNVTESGQPSCGYLSFNGSNQWMQTAAAVDFSATDEMSVFAGVRKVSDAALGVVYELSANINTNNGAFYLLAPSGASPTYSYATKGTSVAIVTPSGFSAPISNTVAATSKIATPAVAVRVNGALVGTSVSTQGTGNYGNYVTYFGARAGTSLYFNGLMFSTIIRGALTSGTLLTRTEQYVARQTPTVSL